jgi:hypothetical protein
LSLSNTQLQRGPADAASGSHHFSLPEHSI